MEDEDGPVQPVALARRAALILHLPLDFHDLLMRWDSVEHFQPLYRATHEEKPSVDLDLGCFSILPRQ